MIEFIAFIFPAVFATAFYMSIDKKETSFNFFSLALFSWFVISNNTVILMILRFVFGHVSTLVGKNLFNVSFTWKFLIISIVIAFFNALITHEILNNIKIKRKGK